MRTKARAMLALAILGTVALGGLGTAQAQYYPPPPYYPYPPPPPPPPPPYYYRYGPPGPARYYPPSPRWRTFNGCPPNFTVQNGLCKPYRGY